MKDNNKLKLLICSYALLFVYMYDILSLIYLSVVPTCVCGSALKFAKTKPSKKVSFLSDLSLEFQKTNYQFARIAYVQV